MIDNIGKYTVRDGLDKAIEILESLPVFPSIVWLYVWDQIKSSYDGEDLGGLWERFWDTADTEGWTLQYGTESMSEHVLDWLIKNDFLKEEE